LSGGKLNISYFLVIIQQKIIGMIYCRLARRQADALWRFFLS